MKPYLSLSLVILLILSSPGCYAQKDIKAIGNSRIIQAQYLGQKLPGKTAEIFAPELISYEVHDAPQFTQDGLRMVIQSMEEGPKIYQLSEKKWSGPAVLPFELPGTCNGIFIRPDGAKIFTMIWKDGGRRFYMSQKQGDSWTSQVPLGDQLNTFSHRAWRFTVSEKESICFSTDNTIMISSYDGKEHLHPFVAYSADNLPINGVTPFIAQDESYIVFSLGKSGSFKDNDLYISYNQGEKGWTKPVNLGPEINSPGGLEICPAVSPDGKYLFFIRKNPGRIWQTYWAEASFIEQLRPANLD